MKRNYQKELDKILEGISGEGRTPSLLLHSCCAPCSSYVLEYLSRYFRITVFYYNPNIYPEEEYRHRVEEQKRLIGRMPLDHPVDFAEGPFNCGRFYEKVRGTEDIPEAGKKAAELHCDYFTTTLSISPLKNAEKLNEIGIRLGEEFQVPYLVSDFKKRDGYKRSIELSAEYGLYRQDYCGCVFSRKEAQERKQRASAREA